MGGVGVAMRTCKGFFTDFANQLPELGPINPLHAAALRFRQGTIPGLIIDTQSLDPSGNVARVKRGELAFLPAFSPDSKRRVKTKCLIGYWLSPFPSG